MLKAQYSAAEAQVRVGEAATGIGKGMNDTGAAIQRAKDKTEELQARASAIDELTSTGALEDLTAGDQTQLDRELAQISASSQVDTELAKLKAEVGSGDGAAKEIAAGDAAPGAAAATAVAAWASATSSSDGRSSRTPAGDRLFALTTAAVTLDTECSLKPAGVGAVIFKPLSAGEFTAGRPGRSSSCCRRSPRAPDRSSTARPTRSASSGSSSATPTSRTRSPACTPSPPSSRRRASAASCSRPPFRFDGGENPVYWIYGFKTGTFWPFVPTGAKERDNATELELKAKLEPELPIEPDLSRWLALFDAPI